MQGNTAEDLDIVVHHIPLDLVTAGSPLIVVDGLVAVDGDEVVLRVSGQLAVEVGSRNHGLLILLEAAGSILDDAVGHGHHVVERFLEGVKHLLILLIDLVEDRLTLVDWRLLNLGFQLADLILIGLCRILNILLYFLGFGAELVVA